MTSILFLVILFVFFGFVFALIAFLAYRRALRRAKGVERGLKMVPLLIHLPPPTDDEQRETHRDARQLLQEKISQAEVLYDLIAGTAQNGFKSNFYGQRHIALEIVATGGLIHYFVAVPIAMVSVVEQAILSAYPGAQLEEVEDHNIFNPQGKLTGTSGGELILRHQAAYPIATYKHIERDPMEALLNALSKLQPGDGAAIQIMIRPARSKWTKRGIDLVAKKRRNKRGSIAFDVGDLAKAAVKAPSQQYQEEQLYKPSKLEESILEQIEEKTRYPGYETLIRLIVSSPSFDRSDVLLRNITNAFSLYESPGMNGFQFYPAKDIEGLVTAFIFRFFPPELTSNVLNSPELATVFHLPDAQYTPTSQLQRQTSKQVDGPVQTSAEGLLLGYNIYRGTKKEIRLSLQDRRRHTYILGQTGTGKSTMLENLAVQDMLSGNGFAFIDPHGDTAEKLISMVPKERAEDVVYFNPSDMERPLGLNLFEFADPTQKDFLINETLNMLYKIYDPGKTGIIGPRFEHWFRNAALTLMADPNGATFVELPKVFTDSAYLKNKFKYLTDPTVIEFWTKEMGQTSDYHKSEMLGWFVSKFGAFMTNELMRNIMGQTKSAFNLREIMDNKKILIVNLSKGKLGEINAQYLGMIFVIKFQAAAMSRANIPEEQRNDFCLYVDEFQNYSTDSFASILSEARKYRLNLIVANQFIGQLSEDIRDAVFGNVGTIMSYRSGPEDAEFLTKQFAPIFDVRDLVGLPNYNAVMRLMMGGLPSKPFSLSALPPLGVAHQEMGLAVKQLSAAKYGVAKTQVEADIFARLQNKPAVSPMPALGAQPPTSVTQAVPVTVPSLPSQNQPPVAPTTPVKPLPPAPNTPSPDIAAVVGNVPAVKVSPPPINASSALPLDANLAITQSVLEPQPTEPIKEPVALNPPLPSASATSVQTTPASMSVAPATQSQPNSSPTSSPSVSGVNSLAGGLQGVSGMPSHDLVQSEIDELANEAMHVSEEKAGVASPAPVALANPVLEPTTVLSQPVSPVKASVEKAPPAQAQSGSVVSKQNDSVRVPASQTLKISAPHELLLSDHATSPLSHTPKSNKPSVKLSVAAVNPPIAVPSKPEQKNLESNRVDNYQVSGIKKLPSTESASHSNSKPMPPDSGIKPQSQPENHLHPLKVSPEPQNTKPLVDSSPSVASSSLPSVPTDSPKIETVKPAEIKPNVPSEKSTELTANIQATQKGKSESSSKPVEPVAVDPVKDTSDLNKKELEGTYLTLIKPQDQLNQDSTPGKPATPPMPVSDKASGDLSKDPRGNTSVSEPPPPPANEAPPLQPGEVRIDEDGNVTIG